jgi:NAD(P)-dependent dehydrogenase (short-subunit alcohol dehydrogenase family)
MDIAERVAMVTGAGVGTGQAISIRLAELGAAVVLTDVSEAGTTLRRIRDAGGRAEFVSADLARPDGVRAAVDFAVSTFGGLDILVNNAGGIPYEAPGFPRVDLADWGRVLDLNLRTPLLALQLALPTLTASGGVVVNIASTAGVDTTPYHSPEYGAAKAGLVRATTCLAALPGVRVNCVAPGWVATDRALAALAPGDALPPVSLAGLCDAVVELVTDDSARGRVVVLESA